METPVMAKKRKPKPVVVHRDALIAVRCKPSFKEWLEEFAESERMTPSIMVEFGLVALARAKGFREPTER
jgi:hypothetical protein